MESLETRELSITISSPSRLDFQALEMQSEVLYNAG